MELSGTYSFEADIETVWNLMMDPQAIANALPGVEELVPIEDEPDAWRANAKLKVAAITGSYAGTVRMSEKNPTTSYRLTVKGDGQQSVIDGTALITLSSAVDNKKTDLTWDAEANISGKLAGIGQRLIKATANLMSKQFFNGLAKQLPAKEADG
jgi:carbon monoxide dehydrogenase subunit G